MRFQSSIHRLLKQFRRQSGPFQLLSVFAFFYLAVIVYCRTHLYRDPTSLFFDPNVAYTPAYSALRRSQADEFIRRAAVNPLQTKVNTSERPRLCLGIASVPRKGAEYLRFAVGSLLEGLDKSERAAVHLIVFVAQTDPHLHPAFRETWLANLADTVLLYDLPSEQLDRVKELEGDVVHLIQKAIFDYSYLLKACLKVNASYIAILEDDIVALDGWYHRTWNALQIAESRTHLRSASNFLYLRLFYTEHFLGWNSEEWPYYTFWSLTIVGLQIIFFAALHRYYSEVNNYIVLAISGICTPLSILLFFAAGRVSMLPLATGVNEMSNYGCCAQGLVFPSSRVSDVLEYYESQNMTGFPDVLTEEMADRNNEIRWALTPSVLQHVGQISTKGDIFEVGSKAHVSLAQSLWNFAFETNDARRLQEEHVHVLQIVKSLR